MRIVSLISSATEILCELGLEKDLVGISHECDYPKSIRHLPVLSEPKLDPRLPSGAIHRQVLDLVREGLSVYRIKTETLAALQPDLIITQDQCEVCAVSLKEVEEAVCRITLKKTRLCSLKPHCLKDVLEDFRRVAHACGVPERGEALCNRFQDRLQRVTEKVSQASRWPRLLCLEWLDPLIVAGDWIPELVRVAGGVPVIVSKPEPFQKITWEQAQQINPDAVAILPCGYPIEKTLSELREAQFLEKLIRIPAITEGNCYVCDGNTYFNRPGPRLADSAEILAGILHPDLCQEYAEQHAAAVVGWAIT